MPNTSLSELAKKFCDFRASKSQQIMIDDGLPVAAIMSKEARAECWSGKRLKHTASMRFATAPKDEDAATKKLRKEIEAAAEKKKAASLERLREHKAFQNRSMPKPELKPRAIAPTTQRADAPTEQEIDEMATAARKKISKKSVAKKAAPKSKASKKVAAAKARTPIAKAKPATAGERSRYDWKAAEEKALGGKIPSSPDFSAPTHARFLPTLKAIKEAVAAEDLKALKAIEINPISSTPKAMDRYRGLCVKALTAKA